jgi:hypothetical protein
MRVDQNRIKHKRLTLSEISAYSGCRAMRDYGKRKGRRTELASATEIATFVYCPEAWRLEYGLGLKAENREALDAGNRHHARKAVAERIAGGALRTGRMLVVIALGGSWGHPHFPGARGLVALSLTESGWPFPFRSFRPTAGRRHAARKSLIFPKTRSPARTSDPACRILRVACQILGNLNAARSAAAVRPGTTRKVGVRDAWQANA